jgi:hypothetical protein
MIARSVHTHTPQAQLKKSIFKKYQCEKSECTKVLLLDDLPAYWKI